jgi:hypothetical protein
VFRKNSIHVDCGRTREYTGEREGNIRGAYCYPLLSLYYLVKEVFWIEYRWEARLTGHQVANRNSTCPVTLWECGLTFGYRIGYR